MNTNHQQSTTNHQPLLWGLLHGLNDFAAGFMLAYYSFHNSSGNASIMLLLYSVLGFGGQLPVGFWLDAKRVLRPFINYSILLLPISIVLFFINQEAAIICSGIASAFVHVTGGAITLQSNNDKITPLSIFTAPGVFGLTIGGLLAKQHIYTLLPILCCVLIVNFLIKKQPAVVYTSKIKPQHNLDAHDYVMLGLLLVMCFRSFIFDTINIIAQQHADGILIIGLSTFAGKIIGGLVADKIGWKKYVYITLPLAFILFQFGKENIYALAFGIACMQSSVPITLLLMSKNLSIYPATATALSLGVSVALAGLPMFVIEKNHITSNCLSNTWITAIVFAFLSILFFFTIKKLKILLP